MSDILSFQDFKQRYPIQPNNKEMVLGRGTYGIVIKVEDQITNEWVAIKISEYKGNDKRSLKNEVELNKKVPLNANIAIYKDCFRLDTGINISDFAVMQYYKDGNLSELLKTNNLRIDQKDEIIRGILKGIGHLHSHKIVHRDLKPANILISKDSNGRYIPKIADFGLSKIINHGDADNSDFGMSDGAGTPSYKAPEQIIGSEAKYNLDLWAFGVILYELINSEKPFQVEKREGTEQSSKLELEKRIVNVILPEAQLNTTPQPYQTIIRRCLVKDINNRARRATELLDILDGVEHLYQKATELLDLKDFQVMKVVCIEILNKKENDFKALAFLKQADEGINSEKINLLINEAEKLEAAGEYLRAIRIYENLNPQTEYIKSRKANCKSEIQKAQETGLLVQQGELFSEKKDFESAKKVYESVLIINPNHKHAQNMLLAIERELNTKIEKAEATDIFSEETEVVKPIFSQLDFLLKEANILFEASKWMEAKKKYEKSLSLDKDNSFTKEKIKICEDNLRKSQKILFYILFLVLGIITIVYFVNKPQEQISTSLPVDDTIASSNQIQSVDEVVIPESGNTEKKIKLKNNQALINQNTDNLKYKNYLENAKNSFDNREYDNAINQAQKALKIKPKDKDANLIITKSLREIEIEENEQAIKSEEVKVNKIKKLISNARDAFKKGDDSIAKANCDAALELGPDDDLKKEINKILKAIELSN